MSLSIVARQILAGTLLALSFCNLAGAEKLIVHHFLPAGSTAHAKFIQPWAEQLVAKANGELEIEIFPAMTLGGTPPQLYSQVRDGTVDIIWTVLGYTPGVFPRTEVFELPTVHQGNATQTNLAIAEVFAEYLAAEFSEVYPLLIHVHTGNALHLTADPVTKFVQLRGRKIRTPSRTGGWLLESWQADPVGMPVPELIPALANGSVEGALLPYEVMAPLRVFEHIHYVLEGESRFGTSIFLFALNKDRFNQLSPQLQALITASTEQLAAQAGEIWAKAETTGQQQFQNSGGQILPLPAKLHQHLVASTQQVEQQWLATATENGIPAHQLLTAAKAAIRNQLH